MFTSASAQQEPITVTLRYRGERFLVSKELASSVFIHEQGKVAIPNRTESSAYTMDVAKESIEQVVLPVIHVFFVNNANTIHPYIHNKGDTLTLEVYPLRNGIFYCKSYTPQEISEAKAKQLYDGIENDITSFLEHPTQGDTLKQPSNLVDSRYTQQLVKNLSNDNEVYIEQTVHGDGVKYTKFLGIKLKKERVGYSSTYYEGVRMSDFARARLKEIFRPIYWSFSYPDANASAEEWQAWLDALLKKDSTYNLIAENKIYENSR